MSTSLLNWFLNGMGLWPFLRLAGLVFSVVIGWAAANVVAQLTVQLINALLG